MVLAGFNFWGSIMSVFKSFLLAVTLLATAAPAFAWDGTEVLEADGYITRWVTYRSTPTPGYCDWRPDSPPVLGFEATNADGAGNLPCDDPWYVHCSSDSLVYRGAWTPHSASPISSTNYESTLTCTVNVTAETGMFCTRSSAGNLDVDSHRLFLEHPGGEVVNIFEEGVGPDDVQLVLNPGTYDVTVIVFANQSLPGGTYDSYAGHVAVVWDDPATVAVEPVSWSSVKAIFR
jgi:hypothetical protein